MEKKIINVRAEYDFDWTCGATIEQIRADLNILENMGVNKVEIEVDDCNILFYGIIKRLETDSECQDRNSRFEAHMENIRRRELEALKDLKLKYEK